MIGGFPKLFLALFLCLSVSFANPNDPNSIDREIMKQFVDLVYMGNIVLDFDQGLCIQQGITCSGGRIVTLNFTGAGLRGQIPRVLRYMDNLEVLDLSNNELTGTVPKGFQDLNHLNTLYLNDNRFFGTIPSQWSNLDNLVALNTANNFLAGSFPPLRLSQFHTLKMLGTNKLCPYPDYSSVPINDYVYQPSCNICNENSCLGQGDCKVQSNYQFKCNCFSGIDGEYCEGHHLEPNNQYDQDWSYSSASFLSVGLFFSLFLPFLSFILPLF